MGFGALFLIDEAGAAIGTVPDFELCAFAWKPFLQCLQRMGLEIHSAGMLNTLWQWGHFACTVGGMSDPFSEARGLSALC
jgi:hypothetical protein